MPINIGPSAHWITILLHKDRTNQNNIVVVIDSSGNSNNVVFKALEELSKNGEKWIGYSVCTGFQKGNAGCGMYTLLTILCTDIWGPIVGIEVMRVILEHVEENVTWEEIVQYITNRQPLLNN